MTQADDRQHRSVLRGIARRAMLERGLLPDFPRQARAELDGIDERPQAPCLVLLRVEVPFKDPMEDAVKVAIKAGGADTKTKITEP